jgi:hypothetical protein
VAGKKYLKRSRRGKQEIPEEMQERQARDI